MHSGKLRLFTGGILNQISQNLPHYILSIVIILIKTIF